MIKTKRAKLHDRIAKLTRLANDQRGKPEGDVARAKILKLIAKYPHLLKSKPMRELKLSDVAYMKRNGISTGGSWTGRNLREAIAMMIDEYRNRIDEHDTKSLHRLG